MVEEALTTVISANAMHSLEDVYIEGISTRPVDDALVTSPGLGGIAKSQEFRLCEEEIDERVKAFLDRPIEGDWPELLPSRSLRSCAS